jgi:hypothetical protein
MGNSQDYQLGDRVRVDDRRFPAFWANGATGTIGCHPAVNKVVDLVPTARGPQPFYWVEFDKPRLDDEEDGPHAGYSIICHALWALEKHKP